MKSTYKLFGLYWDGMNAVKYNELQIDNGPIQTELISFQKLLSVQDETDFDRIIESHNTKVGVTIGIDYWVETSNQVLCAFLEKRLGQMVAHLSKRYPIVRCVKV